VRLLILFTGNWFYIPDTEVKKGITHIDVTAVFRNMGTTGSTTTPLPRKLEYSFQNIFAKNAFSFYCLSF